MKNNITTIRYRDFRNFLSRVHIHHLEQVRTINHRIQLIPVNLNIIPHVSQLLYHARVPLCEYILMILSGSIIKIIQRGLITSHIPLVQQEKTFYRPRHRIARGNLRYYGRNNFIIIIPARKKQ